MKEKICRLCLKTLCSDFQTIGESLRDALNKQMILKLNLSISKETVMCNDCESNLQVFLNIKSAYVYLKNSALPLTNFKDDNSLNQEEIERTNNGKAAVESKDEITCWFCTRATRREGLIPLNESKENAFIVDILKEHIPEVNLNDSELLTCKTCHDSFHFVIKCMDVEEKISKYTEIEGTDDEGQIELKNVQQLFTFKPTLKHEIDFLGVNEMVESCDENKEVGEVESEIKYEKEAYNVKSFIKTEYIDIKSEEADYDSFQESSPELFTDNSEICPAHEISLVRTMYKCEICIYETKYKRYLKWHMLTHRDPLEIMYKCEMCTYETKNKRLLNGHMLNHQVPSELKMVKCKMCTYETKQNIHLKKHMLVHKNPLEVTMYKCDICTYETKCKSSLIPHMLKHKNPAELKMYKCEICIYETKHKHHLNQHMRIHGDSSKMQMYKCELCKYETKYKSDLNRHTLFHKNPSEITMYKCEKCTYETKYKSDLNRHMLFHKNPSEITMYKCEMCTYETKQKRCLNQHVLIHKDPSEITMHRCKMCAYETRRKKDLNNHILTHKKPSVYKCKLCGYVTKKKGYLNRHLLTRENQIMSKCEMRMLRTTQNMSYQAHSDS